MSTKINLKNYIADVKDFPIKGILFRDITPLMSDGIAFSYAVNQMTEYAKQQDATLICGPEARGFIFGCPVASNLKIGFIPIRKPNKLPRETISHEYDLEYGTNTLTMHKDAVKKGQKVLIIDDLLATGGTVKATIEMIEKLGGIVVGCCFLIELVQLDGRKTIGNYPVHTLLKY